MKASLYFQLTILLSTLVLPQSNSCMNTMDTMVSLAIVNTKNTIECGNVKINIHPSRETETTIADKILQAYNALKNITADSSPAIIKITQANRTRTPLTQLISEGLALHNHLVLRALLQAQ